MQQRAYKFRILVFWFIPIISFQFFSCFKENHIIGEYESISESEWNTKIKIFKNETIEIINEKWEAGKYEEREIEHIFGKWEKYKKGIILKYSTRSDTLIFKNDVPLNEIGKIGNAPGLIGINQNNNGILNSGTLWKLPLRF